MMKPTEALSMTDGVETANWPLAGIKPIDREELQASVRNSKPVKNFMIENFLDEAFANEVHDAFPSFEEARALGRQTASSINEQNKYQLSDSTAFKPSLLKLPRHARIGLLL